MSRLTRLSALTLVAGALVAVVSAAPERADAVSSSTGLGPIRLAVSGVNPPAPGPGDTFIVSGRAVNSGGLTIPDVSVRLRIDPDPIASRSALAEAAAVDVTADPAAVDLQGRSIDASVRTGSGLGALAPGGSVPFRIVMSADALGLTDFGVHALTVEARGLDATGARVTLGAERTFIVWRGAGTLPVLRISWLIPLQDRPLRNLDGRYDPLAASALSSSLDAGGRLNTLLTAGTDEPITWAVDPDLLEEASQLSTGVTLVSGTVSTPDAGAASWIEQLRAAKDVRALPYGDPDITAQRRAALSGQLGPELNSGIASASSILGRPIAAAPAWPADEATTPGTLAGVAAAGLTQVVLSSAAVRDPAGETATPDALGPLTKTNLQVISSDSGLSTLAATDPRLLGNSTLARLRLLAETAMIAAEEPNISRSVVIAMPRNWAPAAGWAKMLLSMDQVAPWLAGTDLATLTADPGAGPLRRLAPYPLADQAAEVSADQLRLVRVTAARLARFGEILTDPSAYVTAYTRALQRGQSAAWRESQDAGLSYTQGVADALVAETGKVRILRRGQVTLSSRTGKVPLAVVNGLDQDVRVSIQLTSTPAFRLRMGKTSIVTVPAGSTSSIEVPASTSADGRIPVLAHLTTPDGKALGATISFEVRATGYGNWARLVAGVLVVLLAVALVVRVGRRIRAGAAEADAAARDIIAEEAGRR